ncbi:hypothetical protein HELRODRAFT_171298 [Helobdella robusta]|uniref:Phytanoyl-CoA hydroxylase-interacting protein-like C-terminal domain-containing protein n=1 Tax=Helobdella robusta TaxID=6412 RepID=T1F419_HELRO|nr:hypothetical protein HELRODRAFT_171298 [Helobdella robusta]ESO05639.1 hypothetical protein HELRODRAFT_171298 [Helobdella robusta]
MGEGFSKDELLQLLDKAKCRFPIEKNVLCKYFYRNKSAEYFESIHQLSPSIMRTYVKDNSGDPRCPINGLICGLFFMASVEEGHQDGTPKIKSQFGRRRLIIPIKCLFNVELCNLYFSDFYCMKGINHYVTVVLTKKNSVVDNFCQNHLILLDTFNNPFLFYDQLSQTFRVNSNMYYVVEVFYTEDVNIDLLIGHWYETVETIGQGSSTPGGLPKRPNCPICNLRTDNFGYGY